jgi:hypothetical protein
MSKMTQEAERFAHCSDAGGPEVERTSIDVWHPCFLEADKLGDALQHALLIEIRQSKTSARVVKTLHIQLWPEQSHLALRILVCLHALKALDAVVECRHRRVQLELICLGAERGRKHITTSARAPGDERGE